MFKKYTQGSVTRTVTSHSGFSVSINLSDIIPNAPGSITISDTTNISTTRTINNPVKCKRKEDEVHVREGRVEIVLEVWATVSYTWENYECGEHSDLTQTDLIYYLNPRTTNEQTCKCKTDDGQQEE